MRDALMTPIRSFSRTYSSHFISSEHAAEGEAFRGSQAPMEEAGPCCSGTEAKQRTPVSSVGAKALVPGRGTGWRHRVREWPVSTVTGRRHKLVIPSLNQDNKFVLVVGDSHLRAIADGVVKLPEGHFSFGVMSTPGASASELRAEVLNAVLPRSPEAVCILAPSNNLGRPIAEAAADFGQFLRTVCSRWPNVVVLDFPPRLTVELAQQDLLRQEYHRVAAIMGIRYLSVAGHFPLSQLHLWCRDGVHLSDSDGMPVLARLLWDAVNMRMERTAF
ncbi:uncharacterized protein LOC144059157 isoform X2 [Vanacampus margaritifer]